MLVPWLVRSADSEMLDYEKSAKHSSTHAMKIVPRFTDDQLLDRMKSRPKDASLPTVVCGTVYRRVPPLSLDQWKKTTIPSPPPSYNSITAASLFSLIVFLLSVC